MIGKFLYKEPQFFQSLFQSFAYLLRDSIKPSRESGTAGSCEEEREQVGSRQNRNIPASQADGRLHSTLTTLGVSRAGRKWDI
jgi:hypothetical protein